MTENQSPEIDERDVARLLRLAGKREPVPAERAERVRVAALDQWRLQVRTRSRRRFGWAAAGVAAAAALVLLALPGSLRDRVGPAPAASIHVEALEGELLAPLGLADGDPVVVGTVLSTSNTGRAAIRLPSGHSVRLDVATTVRVIDGAAVALDRGAIYVDSGFDRHADGSIEVHTQAGVIEDIGTQFEVRLEGDNVRVRLREGEVLVHGRSGDLRVGQGTELAIASDGTVSRRAIATHGPVWGWTAGIAPMLDLEGRTARSFLDWVARERGWTLAFADPTAARAADEIVLGGTVRNLTLDQVLEAVLPTCRMTHRVEGGVLIVAAAPEA